MGRVGTSSSFTVVVKHGLSIDGEEGPLPVRGLSLGSMKKGTPPFVERTSLRKGLCQVQGRYWGKWGVCEEVNAKRLKKKGYEGIENFQR